MSEKEDRFYDAKEKNWKEIKLMCDKPTSDKSDNQNDSNCIENYRSNQQNEMMNERKKVRKNEESYSYLDDDDGIYTWINVEWWCLCDERWNTCIRDMCTISLVYDYEMICNDFDATVDSKGKERSEEVKIVRISCRTYSYSDW